MKVMLKENIDGLNCQYGCVLGSLEVLSKEGTAVAVPVLTQCKSNGNNNSDFTMTTYFHFPLLFASAVLEQFYLKTKLKYPHTVPTEPYRLAVG